MNTIPENFTELLYLIKKNTEAYWAELAIKAEHPELSWLYNAKWIGMQESDIDLAEKHYDIKFTPDHREFLKILHTIDRKEVVSYEDYNENGIAEIHTQEVSYYYNWLTEEKEIRDYLHWPYRTILQDVTSNTPWLKSWGQSLGLESEEEKETVFAKWYQQAPKLIPLTGHRFLLSEPLQSGNPVFSVWGADTVIYGWSLRSYLIFEYAGLLDLKEQVFDEEDQQWYWDYKKEASDLQDADYAENRKIPFWGELIDYSGRNWKYTPANKTS